MIRGEFLCNCQYLSAFGLRKMADFGGVSRRDVPQGLKPSSAVAFYGTAKAVPLVREFSPNLRSPDLPNRPVLTQTLVTGAGLG